MQRIVSILCLFVFVATAVAQPTDAPTADEILEPRWGDERPALAVFYSPDGRRGFFSIETEGAPRWTSRIYPMWKARVADVNGSGRDEIVLGIWSKVRRHDEPSPHKAVWVMAWNGAALMPLWQGSALSRPLVDFELADVDGDGHFELLAIEGGDAPCFWSLYRWNGFGFWVDGRTTIACDARPGPRPNCITMETQTGSVTRCATWDDGEWKL